jgi:Zn finger protein HypA/HybF involved in hydrogenase expression
MQTQQPFINYNPSQPRRGYIKRPTPLGDVIECTKCRQHYPRKDYTASNLRRYVYYCRKCHSARSLALYHNKKKQMLNAAAAKTLESPDNKRKRDGAQDDISPAAPQTGREYIKRPYPLGDVIECTKCRQDWPRTDYTPSSLNRSFYYCRKCTKARNAATYRRRQMRVKNVAAAKTLE